MRLAIPQLIGLASGAGFSGTDLATAVAIALAESGGDPTAYNPERAAGAAAGHGSYGLWQIYTTAHPEFAGENLTDPQTNANAAFSVYAGAGNSFHPWSTFKSGAYLAYVDAVNQALPPAPAVTGDTTVADASTTDPTAPNGGELLGVVIVAALGIWALGRWMN
jgi:hypothetical protein